MFKFDELAISSSFFACFVCTLLVLTFRFIPLSICCCCSLQFQITNLFSLLLVCTALYCGFTWFVISLYFFFGLVCFLVLRAPFFPLCALWCDSAVFFLYCFDVILFNKFNFRKRSSLQRDDYFCRPNRFREFRQVG